MLEGFCISFDALLFIYFFFLDPNQNLNPTTPAPVFTTTNRGKKYVAFLHIVLFILLNNIITLCKYAFNIHILLFGSTYLIV